MILLIAFITFLSSTKIEPMHLMGIAPSMEICQDQVNKLTAKAEADPQVEGYVFQCIVVPTKT